LKILPNLSVLRVLSFPPFSERKFEPQLIDHTHPHSLIMSTTEPTPEEEAAARAKERTASPANNAKSQSLNKLPYHTSGLKHSNTSTSSSPSHQEPEPATSSSKSTGRNSLQVSKEKNPSSRYPHSPSVLPVKPTHFGG
jgi:hypothetical protein